MVAFDLMEVENSEFIIVVWIISVDMPFRENEIKKAYGLLKQIKHTYDTLKFQKIMVDNGRDFDDNKLSVQCKQR